MMERLACFGRRPVAPLQAFGSKAFEKGLRAGRLDLLRCRRCDLLALLATPRCTACGTDAFEAIPASGRATLYSFTTVHAAPGALARLAPYSIGLIDLEEGVRVMVRLVTDGDGRFSPDMPMRLVVCDYVDGPVLAACRRDAGASDLNYEKRKERDVPAHTQDRPDLFKALMIERQDRLYVCEQRTLRLDELPPGDLLVRVRYSSLNYKDALALTGQAPIVRKFPMVPGIDLAGVVVESASPKFNPGDEVVVNGFGLSETRWGGYAEYQRLPENVLVPLPSGFGAEDAMLVGTAGYTAMLCVQALLDHGLKPDRDAVLITGASGGVGSVALSLLAGMGYRTIAVTGRPEQGPFLKQLGATDIVSRADLGAGGKALGAERWAGAIDVAGGQTLADVIAQTRYDGIVACCGMAAGGDLPASVYPFILRGVTLRGIDSVMVPLERRLRAWAELDKHLDRDLLRSLGATHDFDRLTTLAGDLLEGRLHGRVAIKVAG